MKELKVTPIKNGTVIDHIPPGFALKVLHVLNIPEETLRYWKNSLKSISDKKGRAAPFSAGDLLALKITKLLINNLMLSTFYKLPLY